MLRLALVVCELCAAAAARTHCHFHEEVRDGDIWVVNCYGSAETKVAPLEQGDFRYEASGAEWSSRDERMSTIAVDLSPGATCTRPDIERMARCLQVPHQYAWCGSTKVARFAGDSSFPSYAESAADMVRVGRACAPHNATVRATEPLRAYNARHVRKMRKARQDAENVCMALILCMIVCMCCCSNDCSKKRYARV